jgi:hypothetical protein
MTYEGVSVNACCMSHHFVWDVNYERFYSVLRDLCMSERKELRETGYGNVNWFCRLTVQYYVIRFQDRIGLMQ